MYSFACDLFLQPSVWGGVHRFATNLHSSVNFATNGIFMVLSARDGPSRETPQDRAGGLLHTLPLPPPSPRPSVLPVFILALSVKCKDLYDSSQVPFGIIYLEK